MGKNKNWIKGMVWGTSFSKKKMVGPNTVGKNPLAEKVYSSLTLPSKNLKTTGKKHLALRPEFFWRVSTVKVDIQIIYDSDSKRPKTSTPIDYM